MLLLSPALSPVGTGMGSGGVMGWTQMTWGGMMGRYSGVWTGVGLGCLGCEGEGGLFDWRVDRELDQFRGRKGNWTDLGW